MRDWEIISNSTRYDGASFKAKRLKASPARSNSSVVKYVLPALPPRSNPVSWIAWSSPSEIYRT